MNLDNLGVLAMNAAEMKNVDGGNQPASTWLSESSIRGADSAASFIWGMLGGILWN